MVRELMEATGSAMAVTDPEGRLTAVNRRAADLFGLDIDGVRAGQVTTADLRLADDGGRPIPPEKTVFAQVLRRGEPLFDQPATVPADDGVGATAIEISGVPRVSGKGRVTGAAFVIKDCSAIRDLHLQLRQAQKMEAVGRLAGGMAHDFNNQLMVIQGYCDRVAQELAEDHPLRPYVEKIHRASQLSAALAGRVLAFSRRRAIEREPVPLGEVVRDLAKTLRRTLGEDVRLRLHTSDAPWHAMVDRALLEQSLMNLAINARDAMPDGGEIVLATSAIDLDEAYVRRHPGASAGPHVVLTVSDTGHGMDPETQARIFDPFFTTKPEGKGTGLGLAMVYGFVKQCRGHVYVYSEPGHGTTFKLYFPRCAAAEQETEPKDAGPPCERPAARGSETVLVAEDDAEVRRLLADLLQEQGYTVLTAADGNEALKVAAGHHHGIDLLIADTVMPGRRGPEVAERLRRARPELRVMYTSGYPKSLLVRRGLIPPDAEWLSKPFNIRTMAETVRRVLDGTPAAQERPSPVAGRL
jgi:signal transduction histidine kinase/ActR/RegA family two-component response regulator